MSRSAGIKSNQDKQAWCREGERRERDFVAENPIEGWAVAMNPQKQTNVTAYDLVGMVPMDLKSQTTRWKQSQERFGIPPQYAFTINAIDLQRYQRHYPNILMILDAQESGKYLLTVDRARRLVDEGKAHPHVYEQRKDDKDGNARASWVFDLRDMDRLKEVNRGDG